MRIILVRHATLIVEIQGLRLLIDPMLDDQGVHPAVPDTPNQHPNPLVPLPIPATEVVKDLDAVVVTHLHRDHLDGTAEQLLPKDLPVLCQPEDEAQLAQRGLAAVAVADELSWRGLDVHRTGGRHGTGEIGERLAPVSGFVLGPLYVAGDTIWCDAVAAAIDRYRPTVAVVNAGGARFLAGDPIVMTAADVREVVARVPKVVAVHMEAINHCVETRAELRAAVPEVLIPADGETVELPG